MPSTLGIFEEPTEATELAQLGEVSFPTRLLFCGWASFVAVVPAITTTYSALGVTNFFRSFKDHEDPTTGMVLNQLHTLNTPLVVALAVAALLALGIALVLATNPRHRLASVGLPFSIATPIIAATPAVFLWFAETTTMDVFGGEISNAQIPIVAENLVIFLFFAQVLGLLALGAACLCAMISLCIPPHSRTDALSINRVIVWAISGTLLMAFAAAYVVLV